MFSFKRISYLLCFGAIIFLVFPFNELSSAGDKKKKAGIDKGKDNSELKKKIPLMNNAFIQRLQKLNLTEGQKADVLEIYNEIFTPEVSRKIKKLRAARSEFKPGSKDAEEYMKKHNELSRPLTNLFTKRIRKIFNEDQSKKYKELSGSREENSQSIRKKNKKGQNKSSKTKNVVIARDYSKLSGNYMIKLKKIDATPEEVAELQKRYTAIYTQGKDVQFNKLVSEMSKHEKGTAEWNELQDKCRELQKEIIAELRDYAKEILGKKRVKDMKK